MAAGQVWLATGSDMGGSLRIPASYCGVVGIRPAPGRVAAGPRRIVYQALSVAGPMARSVRDAAMLLTAIAGADPADTVTTTVPNRPADYSAGLAEASLAGVRIGVMRGQVGDRQDLTATFDAALADMERAGAVLVEIEFEPNNEMYRDSFQVLMFELREEMGKYLSSLPGENMPRSLADLIAFNEANKETEMRWFGQDLFVQAEGTTDREAYEKARANAVRIAGEETIDTLLADTDVSFLVAPTRGPAWVSDLVNGDNFNGSIGFGAPAAIAGYPHLTVPMGAVGGLPVGISIIGAKWDDHAVLKAGAAYERARTAVLPQPRFERWSAPLRPSAPRIAD